MPFESVLEPNTNWVDHIKTEDAPDSHRMFTTESYFSSFWRYAAHGVILIDEGFKIIEANPAFLALIGSDMAEIATKELKDIVSACEINTDYTIVNAIIRGKEYSATKEEDLKYEFGTVKYIPVKIVATRVPAALGLPFKHMIVHVYDLRCAHHGIDYKPNEYKNITWNTLIKQLITEHFIAIFWFAVTLMTLLAFTGSLGETVDHLINKNSTMKQ